MVHGNASVAIQVTTPLDETPFDNKSAIHRSEEGTLAELQVDERSTGRLIITILRIKASVFVVRDRYRSGSERDLDKARTDATLLRGVRWKHNIAGTGRGPGGGRQDGGCLRGWRADGLWGRPEGCGLKDDGVL